MIVKRVDNHSRTLIILEKKSIFLLVAMLTLVAFFVLYMGELRFRDVVPQIAEDI